MKSLPTIEFTNKQYDDILKAFGTEEAYLEWLNDAVADYVVSADVHIARQEAEKIVFAAMENARKKVPGSKKQHFVPPV